MYLTYDKAYKTANEIKMLSSNIIEHGQILF